MIDVSIGFSEDVLRTGIMPEALDRATPGSAAYDVRAYLPAGDWFIYPGESLAIPTGLCVHIGDSWCAGFLMARSGLATLGVSLANGVGLIDSDYTGELKVLLYNTGENPHRIANGDRIAQLVFMPVEAATFVVVSDLPETQRSSGGFGSTGK